MVVRVFRARIRPGKESEFERFVMDTGVPLVTAQAGCSHVTVGKAAGAISPNSSSSRTGTRLTRSRPLPGRTGGRPS
jgi:hypothetical protein